MMTDEPRSLPPRHGRLWPVFVPSALLLLAAIGWSGFWFYATHEVDAQFQGWQEREAKSGRVYDCSRREIGGFPFRFEVRCADPTISLAAQTAQQFASKIPLTAKLSEILAVAQIYDPTRVIAEFKGPATVEETGQAPFARANWSLGHASAAGLPSVPKRISMEFKDPVVERFVDGAAAPFFSAKQVEWHIRMVEGEFNDHPVLESVLRSEDASVQGVHPVLEAPFNETLHVKLRGLTDFAPKTWPERFREIQTNGGGIDVTESRIQQGETIAVAAGTLALTPAGYLEGQLQMTIAGFERIVPALGLEKALAEGAQPTNVAPGVSSQDVNKMIDSLDRIIPGLGRVARKNANAGLIAGLNLIGQQTTLENRPARAITLRFVDGAILLGPLRVAQTPPLF
ncbi:conserved hypothetical protein [Afipia carboxidovorans OM5]|uniref:DUF2125 domain-containing protein n=1 Tax=Afipia carboxidovorans (strain ATCC 49405 / DSM 1227 / KCTC 32145 / OM5) TaxID=504832 RepID=B6JDJ9_AFIC5|nr:DUF2125 domain-containing protein [Afipia carboxidovorans]ACI91911.1 conserved hypothetical protein [Afipia carboxidovorans OM5]AEI04229.1 hypothetical protein OCA4_c31290 [Afipia carboxidovorans OM4]AEI07859.1 hypothetical protein OCA5_c31810 [Afipia carboxidovorans OM5]